MLYTLMNKTKEVLKFRANKNFITEVHILNFDLLPEILKSNNIGALERWFDNRSLDITRSNARILLKKMNLSQNPVEIMLKNRALTLVDNYWIRKNEEENYTDFCLYRKDMNKIIAITSLSGSLKHIKTDFNPELTNIGSFDKAWIKKDNKWFLKKKGDKKSIYSELFGYALASEIGFDCAKYQLDNDNTLITPNFTNEMNNLEHYSSFRYKFENVSIEEKIIYKNFKKINLEEQYLNMLFLDALICNVDRHEFNFGVIKNPLNGKVKKFAPIFDNNLAFGATSNPNTWMLKEFINDFGIQKRYKEIILNLNLETFIKIDKKIRKKVNPKNLSHLEVTKYFERILNILQNNL